MNDHEATAKAQREALLLAASEIEQGRVPADARWIANVLREAARAIPLTPTRSVGRPLKVDQVSLMLRYGWLVKHDRKTPGEAVLVLEDEFGVSAAAIRNHLSPAVRKQACAWFKGSHMPRRKVRHK